MTAPLTPMMRQYLEIKADYPDAILFFRLGDFYEMFLDDAVKASGILDIALTSRNKNSDGDDVPLCGIPYHSCAPYIAKLIEAGEKVAICEQVEDPKTVKGIVRREVVKVITPGLLVENDNLSPKDNNYLLALYPGSDGKWGLACLDISTGEFKATDLASGDEAVAEALCVNPREILLPSSRRDAPDPLLNPLTTSRIVTYVDDWVYDHDYMRRLLETFFSISHPSAMGCEGLNEALLAVAGVLHYLKETQKGGVTHLRRIAPYHRSDYLVMDDSTRRNLELTSTLNEGKKRGSLLWLLDRTGTAMGGRKLKQWINYPLVSAEKIAERQDAIEELVGDYQRREALVSLLAGINDLERINSRVSLASGSAKDLVALKESLLRIPPLLDLLQNASSVLLAEIHERLDPLPDIVELIAVGIVEQPPFVLRDGGIIADGYHAELDELRAISREGKGFIASLEARERARTGVSSLKIRYNKVFGYYIELTKSNLNMVPDDYIRKQTLANAERFITPELKEYEDKVLNAEDRIAELEYALFQDIRQKVAAEGVRVARTADMLATLDVLVALAEIAHERNYCRPVVEDVDVIAINDGRHPVIEAMDLGERFVPNDTLLDNADNQLIILTGPNMAGKSTFMRQVALITLMAHIGSFVPAASAQIGIVDRIFTRVGASDNLSRGQSTFMVEMMETAAILRNATPRSLIILDEIGRGTSTFDGVSIAWAVAEFLHDRPECAAKTVFATHYHELTELAVTRPRVKNFNIAVKEWNDRIIFLRKIVPGGASHSYGIQVGRLAGLPVEIIERSKEILRNLEKGEYNEAGQPRLSTGKNRQSSPAPQLSLFDQPDLLRDRLKAVDVNGLTPLQALNLLEELQRMASA